MKVQCDYCHQFITTAPRSARLLQIHVEAVGNAVCEGSWPTRLNPMVLWDPHAPY